MTLDIQYKLHKNEMHLKYLRENSNWYKLLNRNPSNFKDFENEVKTVYKLTTVDRISKTLDTIEMVEKIMTTLN